MYAYSKLKGINHAPLEKRSLARFTKPLIPSAAATVTGWLLAANCLTRSSTGSGAGRGLCWLVDSGQDSIVIGLAIEILP